MNKPKIIVVVGPTASGKSELAVSLAKKYNGEIISADSRQIYQGLDIGSGKVEGAWRNNIFFYKNIPHYLIDEASPRVQYSVARFQKNARKVLAGILRRDKLPIICGGTMHWIDALVYNQQFPQVKPNAKLRAKLSDMKAEQLYKLLLKKDPERAKAVDPKNPHRLIRALEIVKATGKPVPPQQTSSAYQVTWIGLNPDKESLESKILKRLKQRLKQGLLKEVKQLHDSGLSWKKLEDFGLEYKYCALHLQGKLSRDEMESQLFIAIRQYAKRQMTWWKKNKNIRWFADSNEVIFEINLEY